MLNRLPDNKTDVDGFEHRLISNLSFGSHADIRNVDREKCEFQSNSFDKSEAIPKSDFISLEESQLLSRDWKMDRCRLLHFFS